MSTTFNPSDINADAVLSNADLTVTGTNSSNGGVRGTTFQSTGKICLQFTNVNLIDGLDYVGIGTSSDTLGLASGSQPQVIIIQEGTSFSGNGSSAFNYPDFPDVPAGATVDLALDFTDMTFWFRINGGNWNNSGTADPATNTGGHTIETASSFTPYVRVTNTSASATLNPSPTSLPSGFSAWDAPPAGVTGTWDSTEAADTMIVFGSAPPNGSWSSTEHPDTWATSSGFTRLGVENFVVNNGAPISFTTNGPDRILLLSFSSVAVVGEITSIASITDTAGLAWQGESFIVAGEDQNSDNMLIEYWWAYAHDQVTSDTLTLTPNSGGTSTTLNYIGCAIKGLNGNYNYPFDVGVSGNPFSYGGAVGAFTGAQTTPEAWVPYSDGPLVGASASSPVFTTADATNATLSGGDLTITSTGTNPSYAFIDPSSGVINGRYYFEVKFVDINGTEYGAGILYFGNLLSTFLSSAGTGGALVRGDGSIWVGGSQVGSLGVTPANNDVIGIAFDLNEEKFWAIDITQSGEWNGSPAADPAVGAGGITIPPSNSISNVQLFENNGSPLVVPIGAPANGSSSAEMTFNFGGTTYAGTAPTSFADIQTFTASTSFLYNAITFCSLISITTSAFGAVDTAPIGFTLGTFAATGGSQRNMASSLSYEVLSSNVLLSADDIITGSNTAPNWAMLYDTVVQGFLDPGSWESTENADVMVVLGHPGASGFIGSMQAVENPDVAAIFGFERDSGVWFSTENTDTFSAFIFQPLTGHLTTTENPDHFAATGLGRGENGVWASTEATDIFDAIGDTPISGTFVTTDHTDRFSALGAGASRKSSRHQAFIT